MPKTISRLHDSAPDPQDGWNVVHSPQDGVRIAASLMLGQIVKFSPENGANRLYGPGVQNPQEARMLVKTQDPTTGQTRDILVAHGIVTDMSRVSDDGRFPVSTIYDTPEVPPMVIGQPWEALPGNNTDPVIQVLARDGQGLGAPSVPHTVSNEAINPISVAQNMVMDNISQRHQIH